MFHNSIHVSISNHLLNPEISTFHYTIITSRPFVTPNAFDCAKIYALLSPLNFFLSSIIPAENIYISTCLASPTVSKRFGLPNFVAFFCTITKLSNSLFFKTGMFFPTCRESVKLSFVHLFINKYSNSKIVLITKFGQNRSKHVLLKEMRTSLLYISINYSKLY